MGSYVLKQRDLAQLFKLLEPLEESRCLAEGLPEFAERACSYLGCEFMTVAASPVLNSMQRDFHGPWQFDWLETGRKPPLIVKFTQEVMASDFVSFHAAKNIGRVIRDQEMMDHRALRKEALYGYGVDSGCRLERVQAWLIEAADGMLVGGAMYRTENLAFAERERAMLQAVIPTLKNAVVRSRRNQMRVDEWRRDREANGEAVILFAQSGKELARTKAVNGLINNWFALDHKNSAGLPAVLINELEYRGLSPSTTCDEAVRLTRENEDAKISVRFRRLATGGWEVILVEQSKRIELPRGFAARHRLSDLNIETLLVILKNPRADDDAMAKNMNCSSAAAHERIRRLRDKLNGIYKADIPKLVDDFRQNSMR